MEFSGLFVKYPANRPLTEQEKAHHLEQKQRLNLEPRYQLSVIKMNSTFFESVDKWFAWKGFVSAVSIAILSVFGILLGGGLLLGGNLVVAEGIVRLHPLSHAI